MEIYKEVMLSIVQEGYVLKNQAREIPVKEEKTEDNSFSSSLKANVKTDEEIANQKEEKQEVYTKEEVEKER